MVGICQQKNHKKCGGLLVQKSIAKLLVHFTSNSYNYSFKHEMEVLNFDEKKIRREIKTFCYTNTPSIHLGVYKERQDRCLWQRQRCLGSVPNSTHPPETKTEFV